MSEALELLDPSHASWRDLAADILRRPTAAARVADPASDPDAGAAAFACDAAMHAAGGQAARPDPVAWDIVAPVPAWTADMSCSVADLAGAIMAAAACPDDKEGGAGDSKAGGGVSLCLRVGAAAGGAAAGFELRGSAFPLSHTLVAGGAGSGAGMGAADYQPLLLLLLSPANLEPRHLQSAGLYLSDLGAHGCAAEAAVLSSLLARERRRAEAAEEHVAVLRAAVETALQEQDDQHGRVPAPAALYGEGRGAAGREAGVAPAEVVMQLLDRIVLGEQVSSSKEASCLLRAKGQGNHRRKVGDADMTATPLHKLSVCGIPSAAAESLKDTTGLAA